MSPRMGRAAGSREGRRSDDLGPADVVAAGGAPAAATTDATPHDPAAPGTPDAVQDAPGPRDGGDDVADAGRGPDRAQYVLAAVLALVGVWTLVDSARLAPGFADQVVQPSTFGYVIGSALVLLAGALAVATARGDRPEPEAGEDVDLGTGTDWRTLAGLAGVLAATVALLDTLGWAVVGALLFAGAATVLGNRHWVRNLVIGAVLSVSTWYGFYVGLGIPIPAGILDGVL